jgi:hypothetical protein
VIAVELETSIVNHRLDIVSNLLPSNVQSARVIVMYDEPGAASVAPANDVLLAARRAQACFPKVDAQALQGDLAALRDEWAHKG